MQEYVNDKQTLRSIFYVLLKTLFDLEVLTEDYINAWYEDLAQKTDAQSSFFRQNVIHTH